jgi:hypothetical protein
MKRTGVKAGEAKEAVVKTTKAKQAGANHGGAKGNGSKGDVKAAVGSKSARTAGAKPARKAGPSPSSARATKSVARAAMEAVYAPLRRAPSTKRSGGRGEVSK